MARRAAVTLFRELGSAGGPNAGDVVSKRFLPEKSSLTKSLTGLTLVEMTLVLIIILCLAGLVFPVFKNSLKKAVLDSSVQKTLAMLDYAAGRAALTDRGVAVEFEAAKQKISFDVSDPDRQLREIVFSGGMTFESDAKEVRVFPDGRWQKFTLVFKDARGAKARISNDGLGGRMKVEMP